MIVILEKCLSVIRSCKNMDHFEIAVEYCRRAERFCQDKIDKDSFNIFIIRINHELVDKINRLQGVTVLDDYRS